MEIVVFIGLASRAAVERHFIRFQVIDHQRSKETVRPEIL